MANVNELSFDDLVPKKNRGVLDLSFDDLIKKPEPSTLSRAAAGAAGYNDAMLAGLPGLPVDTALNVADLARAGYGYVGSKLGMKDLPETLDRSKYIGSSAWIHNKIKDAGGGVFVENPNPDDPTSRFLNTTARNVAGARAPWQAAAGTTAGVSQATAEQMGFGPEGQIIASMLPQGAGAAARATVKTGLTGGERSRAQMRDNLGTLREAGVENPSAGLAGTRTTAALEALAARYPGSAGIMAENARAAQAGMGSRVRDIADQITANRGEAATGSATQQDITGRWKPKFDDLYEQMDLRVQSKVGDQRVPIENTLARTGALSGGIPGAPAVSGMLLSKSGIPPLDQALRNDAAIPSNAMRAQIPGLVANVEAAQTRYSQLVQESGIAQAFGNDASFRGGNWSPIPGMPRVSGRASNFPDREAEGASAFSDINAMLPGRRQEIAEARTALEAAQTELAAALPSLPYPALRGVGSMIGKQAGDNLLHGNVEAGRYKQVYGAIADDKAAAANAAGAGRDLERANRFYSQGATKMEGVLQPYTKDGVTPEQAYNQFRSTVISSPSKAHALRRSLSPEVRKMQTATLVDELGQATPGRQDAGGTLFSSETFLTNWNKLSPTSKAVIFSGFEGAGTIRTDLEKVAKAAELVRKKGGVYANPSGTSGAVTQVGVGGAAVMGAVTGNVPLLASALGSVAGANITSRMLTHPRFVNWLASTGGVIDPKTAQLHVRRLAVISNHIADPETRADIERFAASLEEQ